MTLRMLLKMGAFLISGSIFNKVKGECNEGLGEGWPRKFLRHFVNGSSKRKKFSTKI
jgi:hypothetical protein